MMARYFSKIGVWLFIISVAWYLSGNFLIDHLKKEKIAYFKNRHVTQQQADIGSNSRVLISAPDDETMYFTLIFDSTASKVSINNENLQVAASTRLVDGVFNVVLSKVATPVLEHHSSRKIEIHLPSSVSKVEIAGGSFVDISGRLPAPGAELMLELTDCAGRVDFKEFVVNELKLVAHCKVPPKEKCCTTHVELGEHIDIQKLEVTLPYGDLNFAANVLPQQILLNIGDDVTISARRAFLEKARFPTGPK